MHLHGFRLVCEVEGGEKDVVDCVAKLSAWKLRNLKCPIIQLNLPWHSTVDGKVERVGETDESIDDQDNVFGNTVIHKAKAETKWSRNLRKQPKFPICLPVRECVKSSDDHERYLRREEESND